MAHDADRFVNVRYADVILPYAKSLEELERMTELLLNLSLHASEIKIFHREFADSFQSIDFVDTSGAMIGILHVDSAYRYLGRILHLDSKIRISKELDHRIKQA